MQSKYKKLCVTDVVNGTLLILANKSNEMAKCVFKMKRKTSKAFNMAKLFFINVHVISTRKYQLSCKGGKVLERKQGKTAFDFVHTEIK